MKRYVLMALLAVSPHVHAEDNDQKSEQSLQEFEKKRQEFDQKFNEVEKGLASYTKHVYYAGQAFNCAIAAAAGYLGYTTYQVGKLGQDLNKLQNENDVLLHTYNTWTKKSINTPKSRLLFKNIGRQARNSLWRVAPYAALLPIALSGSCLHSMYKDYNEYNEYLKPTKMDDSTKK